MLMQISLNRDSRRREICTVFAMHEHRCYMFVASACIILLLSSNYCCRYVTTTLCIACMLRGYICVNLESALSANFW